MTVLPPLDERDATEFSMAADSENHIFLSGGYSPAGKQVSAINTQTRQWRDLPQTNHGRSEHTSQVIEGCLYLFGGRTEKFEPLNSIERLRLFTAEEWTVVTRNEVIKRLFASLTCISHNKVSIFGNAGRNSG